MDLAAAAMIGGGIAAGAAAIGAALGVGNVVSSTLEGVARQPDAKGSLQGLMFIGVGLTDVLPLLTWLIALIMVFSKM